MGGGGGQGIRTPLKNQKFIGLPSNIGPDPLKNDKATKPAFNVGHYRPASETPFLMAILWQVNNYPFLVVFGALLP